MPRLRYTSAAIGNLADIASHIARASGNRAVAARFVGQIRGQCAKLASLSGTVGRHRPELRADIRSFPSKGYVIFFRYVGQTLEIVNVR